jgi:hypothetical protein
MPPKNGGVRKANFMSYLFLHDFFSRIVMAQTIVVFGLLVTALLVSVDGDNCINMCISNFRQCHGICSGVTQCTICVEYKRGCMDNCFKVTSPRKRRHTLTQKLEPYKRKWLIYYKLRRELGLFTQHKQ